MKKSREIATASKINKYFSKATKICLLFLLLGCQNIDTINSRNYKKLKLDSCLDDFTLKNLNASLIHCNKVIEQFPNNYMPFLNRSMIYAFLGKTKSACEDNKKAIEIIENESIELSSSIEFQIKVRQEACKQSDNILTID